MLSPFRRFVLDSVHSSDAIVSLGRVWVELQSMIVFVERFGKRFTFTITVAHRKEGLRRGGTPFEFRGQEFFGVYKFSVPGAVVEPDIADSLLRAIRLRRDL